MKLKDFKIQYKKLDIYSRIELFISLVIRLLFVFAIIEALYFSNYLILFLTLFALILTFIPAILKKNYHITLPTEFEFTLILFIFASIYLGELKDFYVRFAWWDTMLHGISGLTLGLIGFLIVYILYRNKKIKSKPVFVAVFTICFAVSLGVFWEIFEYFMDLFLGFNMQKSGLTDTMSDLIIDTLGGGIAAISGYFYVKGGDSLIIKSLLKIIYSSKKIQ